MSGDFDGLLGFDGKTLVADDPITKEDLDRLKTYQPAPTTFVLTGLLIHCDGSVNTRGNPSGVEAAYGYVIYGHVGSVDGHGWVKIAEGWGTVPKEHGTTTNVGEYYAVVMALEKVAELGYGGVRAELRSDSQLIINQVNGRYAITKPHLLKLWQKIADLKAVVSRVKFVWVPREQNAYADELAGRAWKGGK